MASEAEPLPAPNPEDPERPFIDGENVFEVGTFPAFFPVRGTQGDTTPWDFASTIFLVLYIVVIGLTVQLFDKRWKVVVSRARHQRLAVWHIVSVEFFDSEQLAEQHRAEMLRNWTTGMFANSLPMSSADIRRIRNANKQR